MKSRPILFSAPMVLAIRDGIKDQTRRIAKLTDSGRVKKPGQSLNWHPEDPNATLACPYGQPGDQLWIKETWRTWRSLDHCKPSGIRDGAAISYEADGRTNINNHERGPLIDAGRIRQSIYMRKWMSLITLSITAIRLQRLQEITDEDAEAEGVKPIIESGPFPTWQSTAPSHLQQVKSIDHITPYRTLWNSINGPDSWNKNPYVWAVTFKPIIRA